MCERNVTDSLTITLLGGNEVEPSSGVAKSRLKFVATVLDQDKQPPKTPVDIKISLTVESKSGGHDHGASDRSRGSIAGAECKTDETCKTINTASGIAEFTFDAPEASGTHTITATCDGCGNADKQSVDVKVNGLEAISASTFYTFVGETEKHPGNHYLTPEATAILWRIAVSYQVEQQFKLLDPTTRRFTIPPPLLHVNDASLKWGGLFDIAGKWVSPHVEHRRGTVVDIRANALPTAIPAGNFEEFMLLAVSYGADAFLETPSVDRRHFHLRLLNREE